LWGDGRSGPFLSGHVQIRGGNDHLDLDPCCLSPTTFASDFFLSLFTFSLSFFPLLELWCRDGW
jgi:hypothetical protein